MKKRKRKRKREKKERKGKARTYLLLSSPTLEALKEGATQPRLSLLMQANLNLNWNRFKDVKCVNREMIVNIERYKYILYCIMMKHQMIMKKPIKPSL